MTNADWPECRCNFIPLNIEMKAPPVLSDGAFLMPNIIRVLTFPDSYTLIVCVIQIHEKHGW